MKIPNFVMVYQNKPNFNVSAQTKGLKRVKKLKTIKVVGCVKIKYRLL